MRCSRPTREGRVTEQPRESLADLIRAATGAVEREGERCETWSPLAAAAWRARAKRLRAVADALPGRFSTVTLQRWAWVCDDRAVLARDERSVVTADSLRRAARLLRALAGEEG